MDNDDFEIYWKSLLARKNAQDKLKKQNGKNINSVLIKFSVSLRDNEQDKAIHQNICKYMSENNIRDYDKAIKLRLSNYFVDKD